MFYGKKISVEHFMELYSDEVYNLFNITYNSLLDRGVPILDKEKFFEDFLKHVYHYSHTY